MLGLGGLEPGPLGAEDLESLAQAGQLPTGHVDAQCRELGHHGAVPTRRVGLTLEGPQLPAHLPQQVLQTGEAPLGGEEPPLAALLALAVGEDAGRLLDDEASVLGTGVEDGVDLALGHDHVLLATDARRAEQILDVEEPAGDVVDGVLAVPGAEERAGDGHLTELHRQHPRAVVERERDLRPSQRRALVGAAEDDVVHALAAHGAGRLCPQRPGDGIDDVRLARPIRADHHGHPRLEVEGSGVGEGLETLQRQLLEVHALLRLPCSGTHWVAAGTGTGAGEDGERPGPARWGDRTGTGDTVWTPSARRRTGGVTSGRTGSSRSSAGRSGPSRRCPDSDGRAPCRGCRPGGTGCTPPACRRGPRTARRRACCHRA